MTNNNYILPGIGGSPVAKDAQIAELTGQLGQLQAQVADLAAQVRRKLEELQSAAVG